MAQPAGRDAELIESKRKLASGRYLRNAWYVAAWSDDLGDGQVLGRTILKEPVVALSHGERRGRGDPEIAARTGSRR